MTDDYIMTRIQIPEIRRYVHWFIVTNVFGNVAAFIFIVQAVCKLKFYLKILD